jgi:hypothetical protein
MSPQRRPFVWAAPSPGHIHSDNLTTNTSVVNALIMVTASDITTAALAAQWRIAR